MAQPRCEGTRRARAHEAATCIRPAKTPSHTLHNKIAVPPVPALCVQTRNFQRPARSEIVPHVIRKAPVARGDVAADEIQRLGGAAGDQRRFATGMAGGNAAQGV